MSTKRDTIIASTIIITSLSTALVWGALSLNRDPFDKAYIPDPVSQQELNAARSLVQKQKWDEAAEILEQNALDGSVQAQFEYAMLFTKGWGVPRDLDKARDLLLQAVQRPFEDRGQAAFELGRIFRVSKGEDCSRIAFEWFTKSAQWGYVKAHAEIGKSYARGIGVKQDVEQALEHYRIAAQNNSASAILPLVTLIAKGSSTLPANPEKARVILDEFMPRLEIAARDGDARAARSIGRLYINDLVFDRDAEQALRWFSIAAGLGDAIAMHDMALLMMEHKKEFANSKEVLALLNESANRNYPAAITALGRLHLKKQFGLPSRKSVEYFNRGVEAGHPGSMEELARLYLNGKYVEYNLGRARELAELGVNLKHKGSKRLLEEIREAEVKDELATGAVSGTDIETGTKTETGALNNTDKEIVKETVNGTTNGTTADSEEG